MVDAVTFVSLGPGDPELITLKGLKALQSADLIFCPGTTRSSDRSIVSRAKDILSSLNIDSEKIKCFDVPMSKNRQQAIIAYEKVSIEIQKYFQKGLKIAITAEGDAGFYSSIHYISSNLKDQGISSIKIAGIPAFIACGALANIHIAKQEQELAVIPGITSLNDLRNYLELGKAVVIMKPSQCEEITKSILEDELITVHYFENVGVKEKEYYSSDKTIILDRNFPYFSLLILHKN